MRIEAAAIDASLPTFERVEYTTPPATDGALDAPVEIRAWPGPVNLTGTRIALIDDSGWRWLSSTPPQGSPSHEVARTTFNFAPIAYAGSTAILLPHPQPLPTAKTLMHGLPAVTENLSEELDLFATARGLETRIGRHTAEFSDGTRLALDGNIVTDITGPVALDEIRADAAYLAHEHRLLMQARFAHAPLQLDATTAQAQFGELTMNAQILGVFDGETFRAAHSDPQLKDLPSTRASADLLTFAHANGIMLLAYPELPAEIARRYDYSALAGPVLGQWSSAVAPLGRVQALVLLEHPALRLPPPTREAMEAAMGAGVDKQLEARAVAAYRKFRGI